MSHHSNKCQKGRCDTPTPSSYPTFPIPSRCSTSKGDVESPLSEERLRFLSTPKDVHGHHIPDRPSPYFLDYLLDPTPRKICDPIELQKYYRNFHEKCPRLEVLCRPKTQATFGNMDPYASDVEDGFFSKRPSTCSMSGKGRYSHWMKPMSEPCQPMRGVTATLDCNSNFPDDTPPENLERLKSSAASRSTLAPPPPDQLRDEFQHGDFRGRSRSRNRLQTRSSDPKVSVANSRPSFYSFATTRPSATAIDPRMKPSVKVKSKNRFPLDSSSPYLSPHPIRVKEDNRNRYYWDIRAKLEQRHNVLKNLKMLKTDKIGNIGMSEHRLAAVMLAPPPTPRLMKSLIKLNTTRDGIKKN